MAARPPQRFGLRPLTDNRRDPRSPPQPSMPSPSARVNPNRAHRPLYELPPAKRAHLRFPANNPPAFINTAASARCRNSNDRRKPSSTVSRLAPPHPARTFASRASAKLAARHPPARLAPCGCHDCERKAIQPHPRSFNEEAARQNQTPVSSLTTYGFHTYA